MVNQIGELHDSQTIFLHVFVGTAKDDDQEYELTYGTMHTPIVRNLKTGKYFTLSWNDVLQLAKEAGIDVMDESSHG